MRGVLLFMGVLLFTLCATWAYRVNYRTQDAMQRVAHLQQQITRERESIAYLKAEWAYLNRPERLLALAEENFPDLRLMPLHPEHFAETAAVAYPASEPPEIDALVSVAQVEARE